jgi:hypothetical protein
VDFSVLRQILLGQLRGALLLFANMAGSRT